MTLNDSAAVLDAIRGRRSAPRFRPEPVPRAALETIVEAARWAPNHRPTEPWRLSVLAGDARAALGEALAGEILREGGENPKAAAEAMGVRTKVMRSPVIVVMAQERPAGIDAERDEEDYAACACATQNLLLAAHALGLAAKWSTGRAAHSAAAKAFLGLAPEDRIVAYIYLGYPDGASPEARRRPAAEIARWHGWETP